MQSAVKDKKVIWKIVIYLVASIVLAALFAAILFSITKEKNVTDGIIILVVTILLVGYPIYLLISFLCKPKTLLEFDKEKVVIFKGKKKIELSYDEVLQVGKYPRYLGPFFKLDTLTILTSKNKIHLIFPLKNFDEVFSKLSENLSESLYVAKVEKTK